MAHLETRREVAELTDLVKNLAHQLGLGQSGGCAVTNLEIKHDIAGLAKLLRGVEVPQEPTNQSLVDAHTIGPAARRAIRWPINRYREHVPTRYVKLILLC